MFSSVLGILCGVFIAADYFGFRPVGWGWLTLCWIVVVMDANCQDVRIKIRNSSKKSGI